MPPDIIQNTFYVEQREIHIIGFNGFKGAASDYVILVDLIHVVDVFNHLRLQLFVQYIFLGDLALYRHLPFKDLLACWDRFYRGGSFN